MQTELQKLISELESHLESYEQLIGIDYNIAMHHKQMAMIYKSKINKLMEDLSE